MLKKPLGKSAWIGIVIFAALAAGAAGFISGRFYEILSEDQYQAARDERKAALARRTEAYLPSCEELRHRGLPRVVEEGNDLFFVRTGEDYFHVMGINFEAGKAPETFWWGADLSTALAPCGKP